MSDSTPPPAQQTVAGSGHSQGATVQVLGIGDGRPKSDPILTKRFEALDDALNGSDRDIRSGSFNWNGIDETSATFLSIEQALEDSYSEDRPKSDRPPSSDGKQTGS